MIRLASSREPLDSPAQTAQMMLTSEDIMRTLTGCGPKPVSAGNYEDQGIVKVDGSGTTPFTGWRDGGLPPDAISKLSIADWDDLFCAVTTRLRQVAGAQALTERDKGDRGETGWQGASVGVRASVLECVDALEVLHAALALERSKRQKLEKEVFDVQVAIARAFVDLAAVPLPAQATIDELATPGPEQTLRNRESSASGPFDGSPRRA